MASPPPRAFSTTPRVSHNRVSSLGRPASPANASGRSGSALDSLRLLSRTPTRGITSGSPDLAVAPIDNSVQLTRAAPGVVKTRVGSVLTRNLILKTDFHRTHDHLELSLHGAPNFRSLKGACAALNVFGAAQPRLVGLKAILSLLKCRPNSTQTSRCAWFSTREEAVVYIGGRPFVLRDAADPRNTFELSDRAESLEAIESRLKDDVLAEAARFGGLILTHNENGASSCWPSNSRVIAS